MSTPWSPLAALLCLSRVDIFLRLVNYLVAANTINLAGVIRRHLLYWWEVSLRRQSRLCCWTCQIGNKPWTLGWIYWTHVPLILMTSSYNSQLPSNSLKVSFPIHIQLFEWNIKGSQANCSKYRSLRSQIWGGQNLSLCKSMQFCWVLQNNIDLQLPRSWLAAFAVTFHPAFCWCNRKHVHLLFIQVTDMIKSGLRWGKMKTGGIKQKHKCFPSSFPSSPWWLGDLWLYRTYPSMFFLHYPFTFCTAWLCRQKVTVLQVSWYIFTFPEDLFDTAHTPSHCPAIASWNIPAGWCLLLPGYKNLVLECVIPYGAFLFKLLYWFFGLVVMQVALDTGTMLLPGGCI